MLALTLTILYLLACAAWVEPATAAGSPRAYARKLTMHRWHSLAQWRALDAIVRPESGWRPCAVFPSRLDCGYQGTNSCGIPQANPCPTGWRGRLGETWRAQVRWLLAYVAGRYGTPSRALDFRRRHGWF